MGVVWHPLLVVEMGYIHAIVAIELLANDGQRRTDVLARYDGLFQFYEHYLLSDDEGERWVCNSPSGLYETLEGAEAAARASLKL